MLVCIILCNIILTVSTNELHDDLLCKQVVVHELCCNYYMICELLHELVNKITHTAAHDTHLYPFILTHNNIHKQFANLHKLLTKVHQLSGNFIAKYHVHYYVQTQCTHIP